MADYDNTNSGVLFKNDKKEKDNHPDYRGSINVEGEEFWISAWIKTSAKGKFMSLSISKKDAAPKTFTQEYVPGEDDDIPFN